MTSAATVSTASSESQGWVSTALAEAKARRASWRSSSLSSVVSAAQEAWNKILFPTPRMESWKYTNPERVAKGSFALAPERATTQLTAKDIEPYLIAGLDAHLVVWVDGVFNAELSTVGDLAGVTLARISELAKASDVESAVGFSNVHGDEAFAALATALLTDGVSISVARGAAVEKTIHIVHVATSAAHGSVTAPRLVVDAGEVSQISIVESHVALAGGSYLSLPVAEIRAAQGAVVDYVKFQNESRDAFHVSTTAVDQGRDATVRTHVFSFGGALVRNNATVSLKGSASNAVLNGLSVLSGTQHVDNTTLIHHIEPSSESREHFKGIYADESRGVFSGTITVEKIAQKTNAFQSNQALLLSPTASIETRPQLKIWADDVKCTHGATVGQLDADALFYLRSRGIDRDVARNFLIHAFASEVLTSLENAKVRGHVEGVLSGVLDTLARV
jgi:Fe-S cluster assembly protein SufD